jgi:allantoin racemase
LREAGAVARTRIGLIRVVSFTDARVANLHGELLEKRFPEMQVVSRCIPDQPEGIFDDASETIAVPKIIELGAAMAREDGIAALIISCAADPAVRQLRERLRIPVVGAGSASACVALTIGDKVGTLGITEGTPSCMKAILAGRLVAEVRPRGVKNTLDLMKPEGRQSAFSALDALVQAHAGVIALACTGYATLGIAADLQKRAGIPVVDAVEAAGLMAWHFTRHAA